MTAPSYGNIRSRDKRSATGGKLLVVAAAVLVACLSPRVAVSQTESPLVYDFGMGARAMGMGQAHIAVCDDVTATYYNPAALANIRRIELSAGFSHLSGDWKTDFYGTKATSEVGSTKLSSLALAYPFPTYRGSLVFGLAYNRTKSFDSDYRREGFNPSYNPSFWPDTLGSGQTVEGPEKNTVFDRGGLSNWTVGVGTDVSAEVSVGGSVSFLSGSYSSTYEYEALWTHGATELYQFQYEEDDADITGWTASVGTVARIGNAARAGFVVNFPQYLTLDGSKYTEEYDPVDDLIYTDEIQFEDKITLPLSFAAGVSAAPVAGLILAADAKYTDWKQIDYYGPIRVGDEYAYRATTSVRLGAEFSVPSTPLRLRAGYFTDPIAFKFIKDYSNKSTRPIAATIDQDGRFFTFGAGLLVEDAFTVDAAWVHGGYEKSLPRSSGVDYSEDRRSDRIFVTTSFHF